MSSWVDVLVLAFLFFMNGVFAMSEIALVTSRRARLQVMSEDGDKRADTALKLQSDPTWALSTIQVGITSIGILSGIVGESALAKPLADFLMGFGISPETSKLIGIVTVVVLVTYFSIVFGGSQAPGTGQSRNRCLPCLGFFEAPFRRDESLCEASFRFHRRHAQAFRSVRERPGKRHGRRNSRDD